MSRTVNRIDTVANKAGEINEEEFIEDFLPKIVCSDSNCEVVDKSGNVKGYISNQELQSSLTRS